MCTDLRAVAALADMTCPISGVVAQRARIVDGTAGDVRACVQIRAGMRVQTAAAEAE